MENQDKGKIQIGFDQKFEDRWWLVQRISWIFMLFIAILALAGFFSQGYFSKGKIPLEKGPSQLEYQKFLRYQTPYDLKIYLTKEALNNSQAHILLDGKYLECFDVQYSTPQASDTQVSESGILYTYNFSGSSATIFFKLSPRKFWSCQGKIQIQNQQFTLKHIIYP